MSWLLFAAIAAWLTLGALAVTLLHHRGHDVFSWALLFVFLGPLAIPLAVSADHHLPRQPEWPDHQGDVDLLVAYDERDASGLRSALALLGDRATSVTLASVVDAEAADTVRGRDTVEAAQARLHDAARLVAEWVDVRVDTVVLFGKPGRVLAEFALERGYELVIGSDAVAKHSGVPVLVPAVAR